MAGSQNVVQFPLCRVLPAQIEAAFAAVPDVREISNLADAFQLEMPGDALRRQAEAEIARFVQSSVPVEPGARREAALRALLAEYAAEADAAAEVARLQWLSANAAQLRVVERHAGERAMRVRVELADATTAEAARLSVTAYRLALVASAAARVVSMALRDEEWKPFDLRSAAEELFGPSTIVG